MPHDTQQQPPDILFFFSDQHSGLLNGYAGHQEVQTPNLDRLAASGTVFDTAYTSCPLCVPARSGLLTGQLPSHNGVYQNAHVLASDRSTFLHSLSNAGYETVLCGRMHFIGPDQRHGFEKRIMGDVTSMHIGTGMLDDPRFRATFGMNGCVDLIGSGDSPVLAYDRAVIEAALEYLSRDHERPQCLVVGTYGPHFPYVAPPDYLESYLGSVTAPASWDPEGHDENPINDAKRQRTRTPHPDGEEVPMTTDDMLNARAAYYGMISEQDRLIGRVCDFWQRYLERGGRDGLFVYSSDHGDTCGEHAIFGKQTFYEGSARIPLLFSGVGVPAGGRVHTPVSILDIGCTLCGLVGADAPPRPDGMSLAPMIRSAEDSGAGSAVDPAVPDSGGSERPVISEWIQGGSGGPVPARMVRSGEWKLIHYRRADIPDQLFNVVADPDELENRASARPEVREQLMSELESDWNPEAAAAEFSEKSEHIRLIQGFLRRTAEPDPPEERWPFPAASTDSLVEVL